MACSVVCNETLLQNSDCYAEVVEWHDFAHCQLLLSCLQCLFVVLCLCSASDQDVTLPSTVATARYVVFVEDRQAEMRPSGRDPSADHVEIVAVLQPLTENRYIMRLIH